MSRAPPKKGSHVLVHPADLARRSPRSRIFRAQAENSYQNIPSMSADVQYECPIDLSFTGSSFTEFDLSQSACLIPGQSPWSESTSNFIVEPSPASQQVFYADPGSYAFYNDSNGSFAVDPQLFTCQPPPPPPPPPPSEMLASAPQQVMYFSPAAETEMETEGELWYPTSSPPPLPHVLPPSVAPAFVQPFGVMPPSPSSTPCPLPAQPAAQPQLPLQNQTQHHRPPFSSPKGPPSRPPARVTPRIAANKTPNYEPPSAPRGQGQNAKAGVMGHPSLVAHAPAQQPLPMTQIQAQAQALAHTQGQRQASGQAQSVPVVQSQTRYTAQLAKPRAAQAQRQSLQQQQQQQPNGRVHPMSRTPMSSAATGANGNPRTKSRSPMPNASGQGQHPISQHFAATSGQSQQSVRQSQQYALAAAAATLPAEFAAQQQQQHTQDATQPSQMPFSMGAQKAHQREIESKRESEPRDEPPQDQQQQHTQDATQPSQMPFSMDAQKAHQREIESKRESEPRDELPRDGDHLPLMVPTPSAHKADNASHVDFIRPPERLHPTLSCWLKNMKKLSGLIDRLQGLASAASSDLRPQLHKQVAMLRSSFKKQQERCVEFLRLTEEYANRYLLDISAEIEQQRSFLDMLEKRLDMAKTLHGQAMDLRKSYESGTVNAMKVVRKAALLQPIPADFDLFGEVDFVFNAIRRCYTELDKFWTEEIRRAAKALETRRVDPNDAKRWRGFKASLEQTVKSWKTTRQGSSTWSLPQLPSSSGTDLGAIASALSPALATLEETLQRLRASASIAPSPKKVALALRVGCGSRKNNESCLTFFRGCIHFAEKIAAYSAAFMAQPTFSRVRASNDLQERVVALGTEAAGVSTESVTQFPDSLWFYSVHKQCLSLQRGTTHELNTLLENVSSWVVFADGLPDVSLGEIKLRLLHDLVEAWEKGRASIRRMLADLTDDPAERSRCQALSQTLLRPRSLITRLFSVARSSVKCRP